MDDKWAFYAAFEDRYRGSFDEIKQRVADYLPYVCGYAHDAIGLPVIDLGSGRGEWLSLLRENNIVGVGVDQNPVAVDLAKSQGLDVTLGDAFEFLSAMKNGSACAATAFHLVEHLPWELQLRLFTETHRVLAPGGQFIVEWPNCENIMVATQYFWFDPTHVKPLPVQLASFMAEFAGFTEIEVKRFRPPSFHNKLREKGNDVKKPFYSRFFRNQPDIDHEPTPELRALGAAVRTGLDIALVCKK